MKQENEKKGNPTLIQSKSDIKREAKKLQELGKRIFELPEKQKNQLPLSPELLNALEEAKKLSNKEALRRHFQYVGKIIRNSDVDALIQGLEKLAAAPLEKSRKNQSLEKFARRLLEEDISLCEEFIEKHPSTDRKKLKQLVRNAKKNYNSDKEAENFNNSATKKLLSYLKQQAL